MLRRSDSPKRFNIDSSMLDKTDPHVLVRTSELPVEIQERRKATLSDNVGHPSMATRITGASTPTRRRFSDLEIIPRLCSNWAATLLTLILTQSPWHLPSLQSATTGATVAVCPSCDGREQLRFGQHFCFAKSFQTFGLSTILKALSTELLSKTDQFTSRAFEPSAAYLTLC